MSFTLLIPEKSDEERDLVADLWAATVGPVVRIDRFWERPEVDRQTARPYGNDTFCLVLAQLLDLELVSPPDDWLFSVPTDTLGRRVDRVALRDAASIAFPRFVKSVIPKQFRAAVYPDLTGLEVETRGLQDNTEMIVSEMIDISVEARCFVLNASVQAAASRPGQGVHA